VPFPNATPVPGTGASGLLITDEHDKVKHIRALNNYLPLLKSSIDVLYLEHFRFTERNLEGASLATVLRLVQENQFEWYAEIADNLTVVLGKAQRLGLKVHGINIPNPGVNHFRWRMSGCNDAIADELKKQLKAEGTARFGIFIGKDHARGLNKAGRLLGISCYEWNDGAQRYDSI
jgi:hypothetical protein